MTKRKKKNRTYLLFAILASLFALITTSLIGYMAIIRTKNDTSYPSYEYSELIDQSETKQFLSSLPAQLYEAESLLLSDDCRIEENYSASNKEVVSSFTKGSKIRLEVTSDASQAVMLSIATNFVSASGKSISAKTMFRIYTNKNEETISATLQSNFNHYDFSLADLAVIHLEKGMNSIEILSEGDSPDIDYLTLKGKEKKTNNENARSKVSSFLPDEPRQYYQPDEAVLKGPLIIKDEKESTDGYALFFSNPYDTMEYDIQSDENIETSASFLSRLQKSNAQPKFDISLNGKHLDFDGILSSDYSENSLGILSLKKGLNQIVIQCESGAFYFSSLILNSDIIHSPTKMNERYEAEDALLKKGPKVISSQYASKGYAVGENTVDSYIEFPIISKKEDDVLLSITLSYVLSTKPSNQIFETSINDNVMDTSDCIIKNTTGYDHYEAFLLGKLHLEKGKNVLRIFSFSGGYNLDCITLIRNQSQKEYQAEDLINDGMAKKHVLTAENGSVLEGRSMTSLLLLSYEEKEREVTLSIQYSLSVEEEINLSSYMEVLVCQDELPIPDEKLPSTKRVSVFEKKSLGKITLKKGLNEIRIENKISGINYDFLTLEE